MLFIGTQLLFKIFDVIYSGKDNRLKRRLPGTFDILRPELCQKI